VTAILKPIGTALLGAVLLLGCNDTAPFGSMSLVDPSVQTGPAPLLSATLASGRITVSGPDGYCIDRTTLRRAASGGFAAIASCNILTGGQHGPQVEPGLVTVTVSRANGVAPSPSDLAGALGTELLNSRELSALSVGQMASGGASAFDGSDPRHWRGAFVLGDHLIGVTLYAPRNSPLTGAQGAAFLNTVSSRIRARSEAGT